MTQQRLRLGILDDAELAYHRVLDAVEKWSSGVGKGVAADAIGMSLPSFSHALRDRNRSRFSGLQLVAMASMDETGAIMGALCDALGYERPKRKDMRTAEQKLEALQDQLRKLGVVGERLLQEAGL